MNKPHKIVGWIAFVSALLWYGCFLFFYPSRDEQILASEGVRTLPVYFEAMDMILRISLSVIVVLIALYAHLKKKDGERYWRNYDNL